MRCGADRRLLLVQPCHTSVVRAVAAGFRVWSVQDPALCAPHCLAETERLSQALLLTDTGDPVALAALLGRTARRHGIAQVLHLGDRRRRAAAFAAADAAGPSATSPQSVRRICDRTAMRRLLNEDGRSVVRAREARSVGEVPALVRALGLPLVLKRTDAAGGHHVTRISCPGDLAAWTARRQADAAPGPYLLEEYLAGPVFGVHTLTVDGAHHVLALTARHPAGGPVTELYPAPLDTRVRSELRAAARALLDLADYRSGPAYIRLVLTERGARVVAAEASLVCREPQFPRVGGGFDPDLWLFRALAQEQPVTSGTRTVSLRDRSTAP
ncbi:acetyl-CoA carboxylase biotin carboxylase subunit family protein [Streptomyces sp. NPDC013161]|uniref:ATP-grasp domain-containing protein n=1 Tax=Streptomyces sp. NPDC013161 TaxID=3364862 RepID=UPI0036870596